MSTAVIFMMDDNTANLPSNQRVNYFTQVLRKIEAIDKKYAKINKLRKQGLKKEAIEIVRNA